MKISNMAHIISTKKILKNDHQVIEEQRHKNNTRIYMRKYEK